MGPLKIMNTGGSTKIYILIAVEVCTCQVYLLSLKEQMTIAFIQTLEILQQLRGKLSKVEVDLHSSHLNLETEEQEKPEGVVCVCPTLLNILKRGQHNLLASRGISVTLSEGKTTKESGFAKAWSIM